MTVSLTVVGGVYVERCIQPLWNEIYGSGGRAAAAVSGLVPNTRLVAYVPDHLKCDVVGLADRFGFEVEIHSAEHGVEFDYLHPLATPRIFPAPARISEFPPLIVQGDVVLRYGMLEGTVIVTAKTAIHDPQSAFGARRFSENGSSADRLAIVLNRGEAKDMTGETDPLKAAGLLLREEKASVVVMKMGGDGALVVTRKGADAIPVYKTQHVWKIGSGDVFSAAFAAFWGVKGLPAAQAADLASRATAQYCDRRILPIVSRKNLRAASYPPALRGNGQIYLAAPFFDLGQRWLVEEARSLLLDFGARVFSPVHEVGPGPADLVAPADIKGIENSHAMLAILNGLDPGTIFEIGYAIKRGMPVVALAQNVKDEDLKMIAGSGCLLVDDFATAIYQAVWSLAGS